VKLSPDSIVTAALRLIDQHGLAEFSTRKLGAALGCEAMAVYWHFPNKDALLDAVVDRLIATITVGSGHWIDVLRDVAHAYRAIARTHPKAFPLLATRRFASTGSYAFMEQLFEVARAEGIADPIVARYYRVVSSYCNGFALHELATAPRTALRRKFPRVTAVAEWLEPEHLDDIFEHGLEIQLTALAQERVPKRRSRATSGR